MCKGSHTECSEAMLPVRDALDAISGKWKLMILSSISSGNSRFREIERSVPKITSKVLAKELKDLEEHKLIKRTVDANSRVIVIEYATTPYIISLKPVIDTLRDWGINHRKEIIGK